MRSERFEGNSTLVRTASIVGATGWLSVSALAQPVPIPQLTPITVTGSNIPRIDGETSLPVQVITRDEIERANIQTAEQLVNTISATMSFSSANETLGGNGQPGFAAASLRGIGYQSTLILLNGRRIANYAFTTRGGDLHFIPLSAIDRVEVLKDGASAIYGSDAIAGVINFILRKDYTGAEVSAQYTSPEHTGGYAKHFNLGAGYGDLAAQKFNVYAMVDYQQYGGIEARNRPFAATSYIPAEGLDLTSISSLPGNVDTPAGARNPTGDPNNGYKNPSCAPPLSFPTAGSANQYQCRWDGPGNSTIVDPSETLNFVGAFTWQLNPDNQFFLNGTYVRNKFTFATSPMRVSNQNTLGGIQHFFLPPTSAFYPHQLAQFYGIDGRPLNIYWRAVELGTRTIEPISEQWNVVAGMKGNVKGWDYDGAFNYNQSSVNSRYTDGYARESALIPIVNSGVVNPFGLNTPDVVALLSTAKIDQSLRTGKSSVTSFDLHASNDIVALPAGPMALAVGFDALQERLTQVSDPALAAGDILNVSAIPSLSGSRSVWALFAEANIPIVRTLESNLAVRYDHYSDFGGTTNPRFSLRWQPDRSVLLRASVGTGFFAPSLAGLYQPPVRSTTSGGPFSDPARCPVTQSPQDCNRQFPTLGGGNPQLQPTNSSQWSVGGVWAPMPELTVGVDYVEILLDNKINFFSSQQIFAQCPNGTNGTLCYLIHRSPVDPGTPGLPGPIVQLDQFLTNLGKAKFTAIDIFAQYRTVRSDWGQFKVTFNGTYNIRNLPQQANGSYLNQVNHYTTAGGNPGAIPYWHHYVVLDWSYGLWSVTVTENFQTGTYDQSPGPNTGGKLRMIGDYDIWNVGGAYSGFRNTTLSVGIKNLLDRAPPFSNQSQTNQSGYDPQTADPHGRLYWVGVRYAFR